MFLCFLVCLASSYFQACLGKMHPVIKNMYHIVPLPFSRPWALIPQPYSKLLTIFRQSSSTPVTNIIQQNSSMIRSFAKPIYADRLSMTRFNSFTAAGVSRFHTDHDRTTVTVMNKEEGASLMVDSFSEVSNWLCLEGNTNVKLLPFVKPCF